MQKLEYLNLVSMNASGISVDFDVSLDELDLFDTFFHNSIYCT